MTSDPSTMLPILQKLEARSTFRQPEREAVLGLPCGTTRLAPNRDFVRQGEQLSHCCFVLEGAIGCYKQDREGNRQVVAIFIAGDFVNLHAIIVPDSLSSLQALTPTTVLEVPVAELRQLGREFPAVGEAFWRESAGDAAILREWVVNVGRRDARSRMAHFFCELACRSQNSLPGNGMLIPHSITQFQLSDILSLTPVHINRTLQALRQARLIESVERSMQRILDWDGLAGLGDFDPAYLRLGLEPRAAAA